MPEIIRYDYELVAERSKDTYFLKLHRAKNDTLLGRYDNDFLSRVLAWFADWNIQVENVAPLCYYYVGFTDKDDPRLDLWCKTFENSEGKSLQPDVYGLYIYTYAQYLQNQARGDFEPPGEDRVR